MFNRMKEVLKPVWTFIENYPVVVAALVIYLYYLLTSVNFFEHVTQKKSFFDYVLQFDSLIWMWVAAAALVQVQRLRKHRREESESRHVFEAEIERQQIKSQLINDITALLQDSINNPLAVISAQTRQIRRKFESDKEILRWVDGIEGAMKRIENTIRELRVYETQKMLESSAERFKQSKTKTS